MKTYWISTTITIERGYSVKAENEEEAKSAVLAGRACLEEETEQGAEEIEYIEEIED